MQKILAIGSVLCYTIKDRNMNIRLIKSGGETGSVKPRQPARMQGANSGR